MDSMPTQRLLKELEFSDKILAQLIGCRHQRTHLWQDMLADVAGKEMIKTEVALKWYRIYCDWIEGAAMGWECDE